MILGTVLSIQIPNEIPTSFTGIGLAFVVYPEAVLHLPVPPFWSILFFLMLVLLGIDSMFTFVETIITALVDEYPHVLRRHRTWLCLGVCAMMFLLGLPMTTRVKFYKDLSNLDDLLLLLNIRRE